MIQGYIKESNILDDTSRIQQHEFIEGVYNTLFGEDAIYRDFSFEEAMEMLGELDEAFIKEQEGN